MIIIVTRPPLESYLNWIANPAPIPPRKDNQENLPPSTEPRKLPRKMRLACLQHPQPPGPAANHNSERPDLLDQAEHCRLYKPARPSISKDTTTRSRRDNFSGSNLSLNCSQRSHRDYFSGSPCRALNRNWHLTDPCREGSLVAVREISDPAQTPPRAAFHVQTALQ